MTYKDVYKVTDTAIHGFFEAHRVFSNFHLTKIYYDGLWYPSTENAYQAAKFDPSIRYKFTDIKPNESKTLGQSIHLTPEELINWDKIKRSVMMQVNTFKYSNDPECRVRLLATGNKLLEETNYWKDQYWGVYNEKGQNNLGKILMSIRGGWVDVLEVKPEPLENTNNTLFSL